MQFFYINRKSKDYEARAFYSTQGSAIAEGCLQEGSTGRKHLEERYASLLRLADHKDVLTAELDHIGKGRWPPQAPSFELKPYFKEYKGNLPVELQSFHVDSDLLSIADRMEALWKAVQTYQRKL